MAYWQDTLSLPTHLLAPIFAQQGGGLFNSEKKQKPSLRSREGGRRSYDRVSRTGALPNLMM